MSSTVRYEPLVHRAVASQAARQPDATALSYRGQRTSYSDLDAAANYYAAALAEHGVKPGDVIPTLLPRSPRLVALQLAVLKCGAAYTALDRRWPRQRLAAIIGQISPALVVADSQDEAGPFPCYLPGFDEIASLADAAPRDGAGRDSAVAAMDGSAPATVFFTSGTTGGPKGVVSPHRAVTRLFGPGGLEGFGPGHATPQAAALSWDMYAFELWGQLTTGGTAVLADSDHLLPSQLRAFISDESVDTLWLTSSLFNLFVDEDVACFSGLREVLIGGERLSPEHVRAFLVRHESVRLLNCYGPAENTMITTTHRLRLADCDVAGGIPVGVPVIGTSVHVLDARDRACPPGQPGEICIAGQGLANGYLGQAELTAEKFPAIELNDGPVRMYRTGDIGAIDDAGVLHYRGRQDRQVKISGHRIELAEIEIAVRALPGVRDCAAVAIAAADQTVTGLALFYLAEPGGPPQPGEENAGQDWLNVRGQLLALVPDYMVPGLVIGLDRFPVTETGKLDRAGLTELARRSPRSPRRTGVRSRPASAEISPAAR